MFGHTSPDVLLHHIVRLHLLVGWLHLGASRLLAIDSSASRSRRRFAVPRRKVPQIMPLVPAGRQRSRRAGHRDPFGVLRLRLGRVSGSSMAPSLVNGQRFLFDRRIDRLALGDIVLAQMPADFDRGRRTPRHRVWNRTRHLIVKRVVALAGDVVHLNPAEARIAREIMKRGRELTHIDWSSLTEGTCTVGLGMVYLGGDNPDGLGSAVLGTIPEFDIVGRVVRIVSVVKQR